jgi:hypothetical protein
MIASIAAFPARPRLRPHGGPAPFRRYERRRPEKTPLHNIVSGNLESWLEWRDHAALPGAGGGVELSPVEFLVSSWTGSPISSHRRGSTGIATTACSVRVTRLWKRR